MAIKMQAMYYLSKQCTINNNKYGKNIRPYVESKDVLDDLEDVRVGDVDDPSGEFRHTGHVAFNMSHSSMHFA